MSSTPTISCSSGAATVFATTFGLAPGYEARTTTDGGTTSGYSLIGSLKRATAPAIAMVEASAGADRAGCGIQLVVEEHHDTTVGAVLLIGETDPYRILGVAGAGTQTRAREGSVLEVHLLVALELDVDGIDRHQPREQRLIRGHQISRGDLRAADEPGDRGVDLRVGQIELGGVECRIRGLDVRCCLLAARNSRFEFLLGDGTSLEERLCTHVLGVREIQLRRGTGELGLGALELRLVGSWINDKKDVPLVDLVTFGEIDRGDVAGDSRPQLDAVHRGEATREFVELGDGPLNHLRHAHLGRRGRRLGGFVTRTAGGSEGD